MEKLKKRLFISLAAILIAAIICLCVCLCLVKCSPKDPKGDDKAKPITAAEAQQSLNKWLDPDGQGKSNILQKFGKIYVSKNSSIFSHENSADGATTNEGLRTTQNELWADVGPQGVGAIYDISCFDNKDYIYSYSPDGVDVYRKEYDWAELVDYYYYLEKGEGTDKFINEYVNRYPTSSKMLTNLYTDGDITKTIHKNGSFEITYQLSVAKYQALIDGVTEENFEEAFPEVRYHYYPAEITTYQELLDELDRKYAGSKFEVIYKFNNHGSLVEMQVSYESTQTSEYEDWDENIVTTTTTTKFDIIIKPYGGIISQPDWFGESEFRDPNEVWT